MVSIDRIRVLIASYIVPCKREDPKLNDCVVQHGQAAIPKFINGDPKYRAPKLDPLDITELKVNQGTKQVGLKMTLKNAKVYGLKDTKFAGARTSLKDKHIEWDFKVPRIEIQSDYEVNGQVLILPITGKGKANVTLTNLEITYKYDWVLVNKNGKEYMNFTSSELLFDNGKTYFDLKNLFNGDKFLGDNMNRFLNENWKEVTKELGPAVGQAFSDVFRLLLTRIAAQCVSSGSCGHRAHLIDLREAVFASVPTCKFDGWAGRKGSFEVKINNYLVWSKLETKAFPDNNTIVKAVVEADMGKPVNQLQRVGRESTCSIL